jgi:hypothetical protein
MNGGGVGRFSKFAEMGGAADFKILGGVEPMGGGVIFTLGGWGFFQKKILCNQYFGIFAI